MPDAQWLRFDGETVKIGTARARAAGNLAFVGQIGGSFRREHPDVPVLVDRGRYLVVDLSQHPELWREASPSCWAVEQVPYGATVTERSAVPATARLPWVQAIVDGVSESSISGDIGHLASFPTRHSTSSHFRTARDWAVARLGSLGFTTATTPSFAVGAGTSSNLVADRAGTGSVRNLVIVSAHLDSVNLAGGPTAPAPGADDNASGVAGVLELARVMGPNHVHDLRVILFGGEEQGLIGSTGYVASLPAADRARLVAVVNLDMVGVKNTSDPSVLLEGAPVSQSLIDALAQAAATYTSLAVTTSLSPFASDHVPFIQAGLPAVLTIEGNDSANTAIHTEGDTIGRLDPTLAAEIVRMDVAAVALLLGEPVAPVAFPVESPTETPVVGPESSSGLEPQISGRYEYNGGAVVRSAPRRVDPGTLDRNGQPSDAELPILESPPTDPHLPVPNLPGLPCEPPWARTRFTLNIDVDGAHPLFVVSGTVASSVQGVQTPVHFIGQAVPAGGPPARGTSIEVENFSFGWPTSSYVVDRATIDIEAPPLSAPVATVTFISSAAGKTFGPYTAPQASRTFAEVELEIDVEDGARAAEPYDTHTHPDRPGDLAKESLTIEAVYGRAGIGIQRSANGNVIPTPTAGNSTWNHQELHDAMEEHWSRFANVPQWKLWVFLAGQADSPTLGGVMFDGEIDEPGGVDRQGTAIFTRCEHFHGPTGAYPLANPPAPQAAQRELFFDLIHEIGHAFNLAHSFQKQLMSEPTDQAWAAPPWMPLVTDPVALSFMNYPDAASPGAGDAAKWFYDRFRFRFDDGEHLFLRHAPASFVQMGNSAWFLNHGRVPASTIDRRLELIIRTLTPDIAVGQPLMAELRLRNIGAEPVMVDPRLDPIAEGAALAVIGPDGTRTPLVPWFVARKFDALQILSPGQSIYCPVNLTMGKLGFAFKDVGTYTVQASYRNHDGTSAVAAMRVTVHASSDDDAARALFDARVGRVLTIGGARTMQDVEERLSWVAGKLGERHPTTTYIAGALAVPFGRSYKVVTGDRSQVQVLDAEPDITEHRLRPVVDDPEQGADVFGNIIFEGLVNTYTDCALQTKRKEAGVEAQRRMLALFTDRQVVPPVLAAVEERIDQLS